MGALGGLTGINFTSCTFTAKAARAGAGAQHPPKAGTELPALKPGERTEKSAAKKAAGKLRALGLKSKEGTSCASCDSVFNATCPVPLGKVNSCLTPYGKE